MLLSFHGQKYTIISVKIFSEIPSMGDGCCWEMLIIGKNITLTLYLSEEKLPGNIYSGLYLLLSENAC